MSKELKKTGEDYRTKFDNTRNKKISYQTKEEDKAQNKPKVIPIQEANKNLQNELQEIYEAYDKWKIANYENNVAKVNNEESTLFDKTIGTPVRAIKDLLSPIATGTDNQIVDENGNKTFLPSYNELKQQKVRQDTKGIGGVAQDIGYNATKVLGATALDAVTGGMGGKALYWTDMAEDNYKNIKNQGYSNEQAIANTIVSTGTEFLTEKLLGGLSKELTGGSVSQLDDAISSSVGKFISNPQVASVIGSMGSEGVEEFTQEWLGALNNKITLGEDADIDKLVQDSLYSALVGAGSGGLVRTTGEINQATSINQPQIQQNLAQNTTTQPSNTNTQINQNASQMAENTPINESQINQQQVQASPDVVQPSVDSNTTNQQMQFNLDNTENTQSSAENLAEKKAKEPVLKIETTGEKGKNYFKQMGANDEVAKILSEVPKKEKTSFKDTLSKAKNQAIRYFVDKGETIKKISKKTKNNNLYHMYDRLGISGNEAQQHIGNAQTNLMGKKQTNFISKDGKNVSMSLDGIWKDANDNGISDEVLSEYLTNYLNVDRYTQGKPVFGKNVTDENSLETIKKLEQEHPEIKRVANNIWQYQKNQLQTMVDSGLVSEKAAQNFEETNPHYIRIQRNVDKQSSKAPIMDKNGNLQINNRIQEAKGSNIDIMPIKETMAEYTDQVIKSARKNMFGKELAKTLSMGSEDNSISSVDESFGINPDLVKQNEDGSYSLTIFNNGVATVVPINEGIYEALVPNKTVQSIENKEITKAVTKPLKGISSVFRELTTNKNPMFMATNFFKDIGDAPFNSKYTSTFFQNYANAVKDKVSNGNYTQLYNSLGGESNSYFYDGNFTEKTQGKISKAKEKIFKPIEKGNDYIESFPRIAEFISTIKANGYEVNNEGDLVPRGNKTPKKTADQVLNEAMYNSAEITTNFKRGGDVAKALNRNGATFLNASIQGFSKQIRNFTDIENPKQAAMVLTKALIFGVAPTMLNNAMYDDDDEYDKLQEYLKDNYYLFKGKDGQWIRIPKGRAMSVLGSASRRTKNFAEGDTEAYKGFVDFAKDQVAPNSVFKNNIVSPFSQVKNNESWSGSKIISDSMQKRPTEEQYNEKTDKISKEIGKAIKDVPLPESMRNFKSPLAIHYLLDQYSGAIGDALLPMITEKSSSEYNPLIAPFISKFTSDSVYSDKSVSNFYDKKTDLEIKKNSTKASPTDKVKSSYMNSKNMELAELYTKQKEIQNDSSLNKKDKYQKAREVQKEINNFAEQTVKEVNNIDKEDYYIKIGNNYYKKVVNKDGKVEYKRDTSKKIPTEKYALYDYFKAKYEKSKESD